MSDARVLPAYGTSHGWVRRVHHPALGCEINGQSVVRYLSFGRLVRVDALELRPVVAGRWVPNVPTHPAHVTIAAPDAAGGGWRVLKDVELPRNPRISCEGLFQGMSIEEMEHTLSEGLGQIHRIELDGVSTEVLRVECDREHPF